MVMSCYHIDMYGQKTLAFGSILSDHCKTVGLLCHSALCQFYILLGVCRCTVPHTDHVEVVLCSQFFVKTSDSVCRKSV